MGLADTLLGNFSDYDSDSNIEVEEDIHSIDDIDDVDGDNINFIDVNNTTSSKKLHIQDLLTETDIDKIRNIRDYCPILNKLEKVEGKLNSFESEDGNVNNTVNVNDLLTETNQLITEIYKYLNTLMTFVKIGYNTVWIDLVNIVKNPIYYIKMIKNLQFNLTSFKAHQSNGDFDFLPKDQLLSLTISLNFILKSKNYTIPNAHNQELILEACDIILHINNIQQKFKTFITKRAEKIAPNMTALIGSTVTAQLIASLGLETLCSTPACNIPSIGKSVNNSHGFITQCDIVKDISHDFKKQAIRQVCSKLVMCARVDFANRQSYNSPNKNINNNNIMGLKWREEIKQRLDKQMLPPENTNIKPLAIPEDKKSKKRGGKRFKKMRDRMKMSEVEKAQNKMAFGEQEASRMDAFGEEIGLGMLGKNTVRGVENVRSSQLSKGAKEKIDSFTRKRRNSDNDNDEYSSKLAKLV